jgi:hypothetical protein
MIHNKKDMTGLYYTILTIITVFFINRTNFIFKCIQILTSMQTLIRKPRVNQSPQVKNTLNTCCERSG